MRTPPVGITGPASGMAMTAQTPIEPLRVPPQPGSPIALVREPSPYLFTVLDAAGGKHPRTLIAKVERNILWRGPAPDVKDVALQFSIRIGGDWKDLGVATSNSHAFAHLPFPKNLELFPGPYEIRVREAGAASPDEGSTGRVLITGDKPALVVSLDGAVLPAPTGLFGFLSRHNPFKKNHNIVPGAREALHRLSELYQIIYVAPLRDESVLEVIRKNLFDNGLLPAGPILTNDFGLRFKEYSRTISRDHLREFMDSTLANLRGFNGVAVVGGIGRSDAKHIDLQIMDRHGLETRIVPETHVRWWQLWKRFQPFRSRYLLAGKTAWQNIQEHFVREHPRLAASAKSLHERQFHRDPQTRQQTLLDLVSNSVLAMHNSAKVYVDGMEAFEAVSALFEGAESVFAEIFEFRPDPTSDALAKILKNLASAGKPVRITADFIGSRGFLPSSIGFFGKMAAKGVHVSRFLFPLTEFPALLDAPRFRTHRKVAAVKIRDPDGRVRDVAILGGRNWREPYWTTLHDFTVVTEGPVVRDVVRHLGKVVDELSGSPLTPRERQAFKADEPEPHPEGQFARYIVHYPKDDRNIHHAFLTLLRDADSDTFNMHSSFPMTTEILRELIAEKEARPDKDIVVVMGTHGDRAYEPLDAYAHAQGLILKKHGIRIVIRGPLNENKMSPIHAKTFSNGKIVAIGCWNTDEQSEKDLETCLLLVPNPEDPASAERIQTVLDEGIRKDIAEGIDIEDWLRLLDDYTGNLDDILRALMLKLADKTQEELNYFL